MTGCNCPSNEFEIIEWMVGTQDLLVKCKDCKQKYILTNCRPTSVKMDTSGEEATYQTSFNLIDPVDKR
ncbi:hypothetical protein CEW46_26925 [Bacillus cereus]|nr:hypothetical protein CEW46_26925 [Bacillus cereus]